MFLVLAGFWGVLVAMLPEGSQVQCSSSALGAVRSPGAARPSRSQHLLVVGLSHDARKPTCASTGAASLQRCQHVSWFDPAFQFVVFRTLSTNIYPASSCHHVNMAHRSFPFVRKLAHRSVSVCVHSPIPDGDPCLVRGRSLQSLVGVHTCSSAQLP